MKIRHIYWAHDMNSIFTIKTKRANCMLQATIIGKNNVHNFESHANENAKWFWLYCVPLSCACKTSVCSNRCWALPLCWPYITISIRHLSEVCGGVIFAYLFTSCSTMLILISINFIGNIFFFQKTLKKQQYWTAHQQKRNKSIHSSFMNKCMDPMSLWANREA